MLLHASACRGQCFFYWAFPWASGKGFSGSYALRLTHLVVCKCFEAPAQELTNTLSVIRQGICIQHKPQSCGKTHATSRLCAVYMYSIRYTCQIEQLKMQQASVLLPLILRPLSVTQQHSIGEEKKKKGSGGERRISGFLWWQMGAGIKPSLLSP